MHEFIAFDTKIKNSKIGKISFKTNIYINVNKILYKTKNGFIVKRSQ